MISGIHLATALSVMLHMEKGGDGMDKMNKTEELSERLKYIADILDTHSEKLPVPPHIRLHATKAREAADLLSEQQKVIDELVKAINALDGEYVFSVHVGYDEGSGGGNFVYADAIRTDSDAFVRLKELARAKETK